MTEPTGGTGSTSSTVRNPAIGEVLATVPDTTAEQLDAAVQRAVKAQAGWAAPAPGERARLLRRFADRVEVHIPELEALRRLR
ncbi:aldehyde dehydrogenase family protein [Kitasatospora sp. NPDC048296]|uniref:aldehyde dehydrogenase family protein n=1 Tax=Kitasatospora sp. NPDC048296 TaxID=3364048 RepID=UPI0037103035